MVCALLLALGVSVHSAEAAAPALALTKSHVGNFTVGQQGDYTLSVANTGAAPTVGPVTIVDTLPAGLSYVAGTGTGWACTQAGQVVTCVSNAVIPPLSVDPSIDIKVSVTATTPGTVTNSAIASGGGATNTATANDPTTINPAPPTLGITKSHAGNFTVGTPGTYTIVPSNSGGSATSGTLTVVDTLPAGLTFNSFTGTGWTCAAAGQTVTCTSTTPIAAGANANPISLKVNVAAAAVPSVTNTASATGGGASNTASASDPTAINGAPVLAAGKSHTGNFVIGSTNTYTLSVGNTGTATTSGTLTYTDTLPAGLTYNAASGTGWACSAAGQVVTCTTTTPILKGATSPPITLTVNVVGPNPGSVTNSGTASGGGAGAPSTKTDPTTLIPNQAIAGGVKSHTGNFVVGGTAVYTITPQNTGVQPTAGVVKVVDVLPNGLTYVSATGSGWTCAAAGQTVTCTSNVVIPAGGSAPPITLTTTVGAAAFPSVTNSATISFAGSGGGTGAGSSTTASDSAQVDMGARLVATKTHTGNFTVGTPGVWTLGVSNTGSAPTSGTITLTDNLANGLTFVSGVGTGWTCGAAGQVVTCTTTTVLVQNGAPAPLITLTVNVGAAAVGTITNMNTPSGGSAFFFVTASNPTTVKGIPVLGLTKTHSGSFFANLQAAYTLTPSNTGSATTAGTLTLVDTLPAGLTFVSASGPGWNCAAAGQIVTCTSSIPIAAGGIGNPITLNVLPQGSAVPGVTNSATLSGGGAANAVTATDPTVVAVAPVIGISKTHSGNFVAGQNGTYTITPINSGLAPTAGAYTVVDSLPAGLTYVSGTGTGWTCGAAGAVVTCNSSNVIPATGIGQPISLVVGVAASAVPSVTNSATSSGGGAPNTGGSTDVTTVTIPALAVAKSHTGNFVVGSTGTYSIVVKNTGNATTFGTTTINDTLPAGLTFASAAGAGWTCTNAAPVVTCTSNNTVAAGAAFPTLMLTVNAVGPAGTVTNSVTASGGGATNTPTATDPTILAQPVLAIAKTHAGNFAVGQPGVYTIAVSNTGNAPTAGTVTVVDPLPAAFTYTSATGTGWTCAFAAPNVTCTSATPIAAGAAGNPITLTVGVPMAAVGSQTNTATASGGGATNTPTASDPTIVSGSPVLAIAKSHTGNFTAGQTGTYTIAVSNTGNVNTAGTITVTDTLPTGLTFASAAGTGWTCTGGPPVTCTSATVINAGASAAPITLTVNVAPSAPATVTNTAGAAGGGATNTPSASDPTAIVSPVLAIAKSHTGNFAVGQPGVYTIAVSNTGTAATFGTITVVDPLPAAFTYTSATGTGWTCAFASPNVTCTSTAPIAAGAAGNPITLTVGVPMSAVGTQTNTATASGGGATNTPKATDPTVVSGAPVLAIAKSHTGNFVVGQPGIYTIAVSNTGNVNTSGTITVVDTLPAGLTFLSASGNGWTCAAGPPVTCTSTAVIAAGSAATPITLTVSVAPAAVPAVTNSARVSGGGATTPATATDPTTVTAPVLAIKKSHTGTFNVGQTGTYTIAVSNTGTAPTSGTVTVTDVLPAGLTYNAASGTAWTCAASGQTVTCSTAGAIAPGAGAAPISLIVNVLAAAIPSVTNTASASGGGAANQPTASDPTSVGGQPSIVGPGGGPIEKLVNGQRTVAAAPGSTVTYTVSFLNSGNANATNVIFTDPFPAGITPIVSTVTVNGSASGFSASVSGQTLVVKLASLPPGVTQTISVQATVSGTTTPGQTFVNVATVAADAIAPIQTNPATVFNGASNIVYDGLIGSAAPIAGATVTLVYANSGLPVPLSGTGTQAKAAAGGVPVSTANPQTTNANGVFGFALTPAVYGAPGQTQTYRLTVKAGGYRDRNIQLTFVGGASGLVYNVTLTALDGLPLAIPGGFALEPGPTTIVNVLDLLNNIPMFHRSGGLYVNKTADRTTVSVGDRVIFTIGIQSSVPAAATRIVDTLPQGLAYAPHSGTFDGAPLEPSVNGRTLIWQLPSLNTAEHVLKYAAVVDAGANPGSNLTNTVTVTAQPAAGGPVLTGSAQATVHTVPGTFTDRLTILGRVVVGSADGGWTSVSRGVAGVKIILEDGTTVVTDKQGRYSFPAVRPGMHVLRLDESSLPSDVKADGTHAYNDPRSTVRLVHTVMDTRLLQDIIFVVEER